MELAKTEVVLAHELEPLRMDANRLLESSKSSLDNSRMRQVLHRVTKLAGEASDMWTMLEARRKHDWYLEGPSYAISNLHNWTESNVLPSDTTSNNGFDGARALLVSLRTVLQAHHELIIAGGLLEVNDVEGVLRDMFVDFDDKMNRVPLPTSPPENLLEPTLTYQEVLRHHLRSVQQLHGQESDIYRKQWDEARSLNLTQLHIIFEWMQYTGRLPPTNLWLGVITRSADDADRNAKGTVEVFGAIPSDQESDIIVWVYNDNAANLGQGRSSQWYGFTVMDQPTAAAQAIIGSWFRGITLPREQTNFVHSNLQMRTQKEFVSLLLIHINLRQQMAIRRQESSAKEGVAAAVKVKEDMEAAVEVEGSRVGDAMSITELIKLKKKHQVVKENHVEDKISLMVLVKFKEKRQDADVAMAAVVEVEERRVEDGRRNALSPAGFERRSWFLGSDYQHSVRFDDCSPPTVA